MPTHFAGQSFRLKLDGRDENGVGPILTGYDCKIKYFRPDGVLGYWDALPCSEDAHKMYHDAIPSETNHIGYWVFWAYYSQGENIVGIGEIVRYEFVEEGHLRHL